VHGIDMLGFGLSSRPDYLSLTQRTVESSEDFFVESLESWREAQGIPKMVLLGHSLGGYLSVAYSERYPERVEKLILLSPVGVPQVNEEQQKKRMASAPLRFRTLIGVLRGFWKMGCVRASGSEGEGESERSGR
jgi:cardiolipin-specific phospholipase